MLSLTRSPAASSSPARGRAGVETTRRHTHDDFQIGVFHEGAGDLYCRGARHAITPRTLVVVPPGEAHSGHSTQEEGWSYLVISVQLTLLQDICADLHELGTRRRPELDDVVLSDLPLFASFWRLCRTFRTPGEVLERDEQVTEALADLLTRFGAAGGTRRPPGREPRAVQRAVDYLEAHSAANLSLDDLARVACLSKYHFTRVFKKEVGLTPHAYQIQLRVRRAAELIRSGIGIGSAAYTAGFAAQSHLNLHFKRCLGVTPGQYARTAG